MKLQSILFYRDSFLHSNISNRNSIKAEVQLADPIDPVLFEDAVKTTMKRYPYYCVTLGSENGEYPIQSRNGTDEAHSGSPVVASTFLVALSWSLYMYFTTPQVLSMRPEYSL